MALRLRRGTDAERQLVTPAEGELIYTTDTKLLYVGDGSTAGGTLVTGSGGGASTLDALTDTDLTGVTNNQVLTWIAGNNKWEPTTIPGVGSISLNELLDTFIDSPVNGNVLSYDGINWVSANVSEVIDTGADVSVNIIGADSTRIVDIDTNTVTGSFSGDLTGNVFGDVEGNVNGVVDGHLIGSVFGDDSTLIVDGIDSSVNAPGGLTVTEISSASNIDLTVAGDFTINGTQTVVRSADADSNLNNAPQLRFEISNGTLASPETVVFSDTLTTITAAGYDGSSYKAIGGINFSVSEGTRGTNDQPGRLEFFVLDDNDTFNDSFARLESNGVFTVAALQSLGMSTTAKTALIDTYGGIGTGEEALQGTIVYDTTLNKLTTFHETEGWETILTSEAPVESSKYFKVGSYATGSLPGTVAGTIAFDSTTNEFKGYNGTTWVVLG